MTDTPPAQVNPVFRLIMLGAAFVVLVAGMKAASGILVPFLLAVFMAVIATPLFFALQRFGIPSALALLIMILILLLVGLAGAGVVHQSINRVTVKLPEYQQTLEAHTRDLVVWLKGKGFDVAEQVNEAMNPQVFNKAIGNTLSALGALLSNTFLILLMAIFILLEAAILPKKVRALPGLSVENWNRMRTMVTEIRHYVGLKSITSMITGVLIGLWLLVMGVEHPVLLGLLAFVLNYVPNVGSIVAAIPGVLLALVLQGGGTASVVAIGYLVINLGISNVLEPRFLGRGLGLSPTFIVLSMVFWGWVLGPIGMLLAVPLTMTVKVAMESDPQTSWVALLLGSSLPKGDKPESARDASPSHPEP